MRNGQGRIDISVDIVVYIRSGSGVGRALSCGTPWVAIVRCYHIMF